MVREGKGGKEGEKEGDREGGKGKEGRGSGVHGEAIKFQ